MARRRFEIVVSGSAPELYPAEPFFGLLWLDQEKNDALQIPVSRPLRTGWGEFSSIQLVRDGKDPVPWFLDMVWLSVTERKFYSLEEELPVERLEELFCQGCEDPGEEGKAQNAGETPQPLYEFLVVGMAPYGGVALWAYGYGKSTLVKWMQAEETKVEMRDFAPMNPSLTLDELCDAYINSDEEADVKENLEKNGLPPRGLFDGYMKQFNYRYRVLFGHWDKETDGFWPDTEEDREAGPRLVSVEERLFDGTHDKLRNGGLFRYHRAGKPQKLLVKWSFRGSDYCACFFMEDEPVRAAFDAFFEDRPDAEADFDIQIDPEKMGVGLILSRDGTGAKRELDRGAYQIIIFKDGEELGRSENYDQERGAWRW